MKRFLLSLIFLCLWALPSQAVILCNNAWFTTATTGTGTITSSGAVSGAQTMLACGLTDAQVVRYRIFDGAGWEVGAGTVGGTSTTLTRGPVESSNADAAISLSGTATVIITPLTVDLPSESTPTDSAVIPGTDYLFALEGGVLKRVLIPTTDIQTFTATGADTWEEPTGGQTVCRIEGWGSGGSGGKGAAAAAAAGGGGGSYVSRIIPLTSLDATEAVNVGAGGVAQTTASTAGNPGNPSTFDSQTYGRGGGGGGNGATGAGGGGGGGIYVAGGTAGTTITGGATDGSVIGTVGNTVPGPYGNPGGNGIATGNAATPPAAFFGGGGGGGTTGDATSTNAPGGGSFFGGAGGGAGAEDSAPGAGAGGATNAGGAGGAGAFDANVATSGSQPGGGGGGSETGNSGAGGDGKVVVTCW